MVGIGYRREISQWLVGSPAEVECIEITADHFYEDRSLHRLQAIRNKYPLFVHGLGLSLGTPGALARDELGRFQRVVNAADPLWISEHVAFTRTSEVDLGHLNPIAPTRESLHVLADHAIELVETCRRPLILENITSHLRITGDFGETEFLNRLCEIARCGLLLDVTNLYINSRNHEFDPVGWIREIEPHHIVQLHVVGYSNAGGLYTDSHSEAIQDDLFELTSEVMNYAPVKAVIIERDGNFPDPQRLVEELVRLRGMLQSIRPNLSESQHNVMAEHAN